MIPTRTSRPFGRISPRVGDVDLARLIDRTIALRVKAVREQGFAAVNAGCDGRLRTTMFDGSACQVDGEVCIATRQDGISACIEAPTQGNGLTSGSITFTGPACAPVSGWWVLDDGGYLYRVPAGLQTDYLYYPPQPMPDPQVFDLVRSGTWAALMCAAPLTPPTDNDDGDTRWTEFGIAGGETTIYLQEYYGSIGGTMTYLVTLPSLTGGTDKVTVGGFSASWGGDIITNGSADITYNQNDRNGDALTAGQEYKAILYVSHSGSTQTVQTIKGVRATAGSAIVPTDPTPLIHFALGVVTVPYDVSGHATPVPVSTATTFPMNWYLPRSISSGHDGLPGRITGVLIRDYDSPNPGVRVMDLTLPSSDSGVATGAARVAFGYPMAFQFVDETVGLGPSYANVSPYFCEDFSDTLTRIDYDSAYVYPPRLGIEYGVGHLNLCGPEISEPDDNDLLSSISPTPDISIDRTANLIELPNGEVGLIRKYDNSNSPQVPQVLERYRVRPAPTTAASYAIAHEALPGDNEWSAPFSNALVAWTAGDTTFTKASGSFAHDKVLPCVVWQSKTGQTHYTADADAKFGLAQVPTGSTCVVAFNSGGAPTRQSGTTCVLSILGPVMTVAYGWTFTYQNPVTLAEYESALSPLPEPTVPTFNDPTYRLTVTVPTGPTYTLRRTIYRFAYDAIGSIAPYVYAPWNAGSDRLGAIYDRMVSKVGTIEDNVTTEYVDTTTSLSFSGIRPPEPLIYMGDVVTDAPLSTYLLPPLDL